MKKVKDIEWFATIEEVFDFSTAITAYNFIRKKILEKFNGVISTGKESRVYLAFGKNNELFAVKIYLTTSAEFKKGMQYYLDENLSKIYKRNFRLAVFEWCKREFKNLRIAHEANVKVPKPIAYKNNILILEFLGENGKPAPLIYEIEIPDYEIVYKKIINYIEKLYNAGIIHADLSEYNILYYKNEPYLIDFGQSIKITHPNAPNFFLRDIKNINKYFRNKKVKVIDELEIFEKIFKTLRSF